MKVNKSAVIFLCIFSFLVICLAWVAQSANVTNYLNFFWSESFQVLIKVIIALAFLLILVRWLTKKTLPQKALKLVFGIILLPLLILPVFRCSFKVPYVFCRVCPTRCPWGISRTFLFSSFLSLNVFGNFWCTSCCPVGTFQECQTQVSKWHLKLPSWISLTSYLALLLTLGMYFLSLSGRAQGYFQVGYYEWVGLTVSVAGLIMVAAFFIPKFWCRYFCPVGSIAGLTSSLRKRIKH